MSYLSEHPPYSVDCLDCDGSGEVMLPGHPDGLYDTAIPHGPICGVCGGTGRRLTSITPPAFLLDPSNGFQDCSWHNDLSPHWEWGTSRDGVAIVPGRAVWVWVSEDLPQDREGGTDWSKFAVYLPDYTFPAFGARPDYHYTPGLEMANGEAWQGESEEELLAFLRGLGMDLRAGGEVD